MNFNFNTTVPGSFPHLDGQKLCQLLVDTLDIPVWPQLPKRTFLENMYVQFSNGLPCLVINRKAEKIVFNIQGDFLGEIENFYVRYLAEDLDSFALPQEYAEGFYRLLDVVADANPEWIKGQVTGPVSFGLTVTDQALRASLYNDHLRDVIVKQMATVARWQVKTLKQVCPNVILFVDEPYLAAFGSAFITLSRDEVIRMLNEVFTAIHQEGGWAGVHCCANTDWSMLMATSVDILNLDAYGFAENLALYPDELRAFLDRQGAIAWGIIPNNEDLQTTTPNELAQRFARDIKRIVIKAEARGVAIDPGELLTSSLITTSCGLGSTTTAIAEKALDVQQQTRGILQASSWLHANGN